MCINSLYLFHETYKFQKHHAVNDKYIQVLSNESLKQKLFDTNISVQSVFILKHPTGVILPCLVSQVRWDKVCSGLLIRLSILRVCPD